MSQTKKYFTPEAVKQAAQVAQKDYREQRSRKQKCPCGRAAVRWKHGSFACQRCLDIEERLGGVHLRDSLRRLSVFEKYAPEDRTEVLA